MVRSVQVVAVFVLFVGAAWAQVERSVPSDAARLETRGGKRYVHCHIRGQTNDGLTAVVLQYDTAAHTYLRPEKLLEIGIDATDWLEDTVNELTGTVTSRKGQVPAIRVAEHEKTNFTVWAPPPSSLDSECDGILGSDFLAGFYREDNDPEGFLRLAERKEGDERWRLVLFWDEDAPPPANVGDKWQDVDEVLEQLITQASPSTRVEILDESFRDDRKAHHAMVLASRADGRITNRGAKTVWFEPHRWRFAVSAPVFEKFEIDGKDHVVESPKVRVRAVPGRRPRFGPDGIERDWLVTVEPAPARDSDDAQVSVRLLCGQRTVKREVTMQVGPSSEVMRATRVKRLILRSPDQSMKTKLLATLRVEGASGTTVDTREPVLFVSAQDVLDPFVLDGVTKYVCLPKQDPVIRYWKPTKALDVVAGAVSLVGDKLWEECEMVVDLPRWVEMRMTAQRKKVADYDFFRVEWPHGMTVAGICLIGMPEDKMTAHVVDARASLRGEPVDVSPGNPGGAGVSSGEFKKMFANAQSEARRQN